MPKRLWLHIAVDFVTDLSVSGDCTMVLVMMDHFLKGCQFIPFQSPAEALLPYVLCVYGIPDDILLDRGPQFGLGGGRRFI